MVRKLTLISVVVAGVIAVECLTVSARSETQDAPQTSIAVFDFELDDRSAGGGIIAQDDNDAKYLKEATAQAQSLLAASGRYSLVDATSLKSEIAAAQGVLNCRGCEVALARKLGAREAAIGVITRVNRTEYTLFVRVTDVDSGKVLSSDFTGLRMGANYSWPRGVKSLVTNSTLPKLLGK